MSGRRFSGYDYSDPSSDNPIYRFFFTVGSWCPTILRLILGCVFLYHGGQHAFGWFDGAGWTASVSKISGYGLPVYLSVAVIFAEIAGAIGILLGCFTRLAALAVFAILGGVIAYTAQEGWPQIEYPCVLAGIALALLFSGGGNLSVDKELSKQLLP